MHDRFNPDKHKECIGMKRWPIHWSLSGPSPARDARKLFRNVDTRGRHVSTFRRLLAVGPFTFYVAKYQPGPSTKSDSY